MKKSRNWRKTLGYIFVMIGITFPLVAFLMMSYRQFSAEKSYKEFVENESNTTDSQRQITATFIEEYEKNNENASSAIVDPFDAGDYEGSYPDNIDMTKPFAYLRIPRLDMYKPIYLDATYYHMSVGVAQVAGTSLPVGGVGKRSVIAGHRDWWGDVMFLYIHTLEKGDSVYIERDGKSLRYEVDNFQIIDPSEWEKLLPVKNEDMITLLTCEPFYPPRPYRLLVNCKRKELPEKDTISSDVEIKEDNIHANSTIRKVNTGIYLITIGLVVALVFTIVKFIRYLMGK